MKSVKWIVEVMAKYWEQAKWELDHGHIVHEADSLRLDSTKAIVKLGWHPQWSLPVALRNTIEWYQAEKKGFNMLQFCRSQINAFSYPENAPV